MGHHRRRFSLVTSLCLVAALAASLMISSAKPAEASNCSFYADTPYRSGNTIRATAWVTCNHIVKDGTVYVWLRQYRGLIHWALKASNKTTIRNRYSASATAVWTCAPGTGSQRYLLDAMWAHTDPNNFFYSQVDTSPERRITCP